MEKGDRVEPYSLLSIDYESNQDFIKIKQNVAKMADRL